MDGLPSDRKGVALAEISTFQSLATTNSRVRCCSWPQPHSPSKEPRPLLQRKVLSVVLVPWLLQALRRCLCGKNQLLLLVCVNIQTSVSFSSFVSTLFRLLIISRRPKGHDVERINVAEPFDRYSLKEINTMRLPTEILTEVASHLTPLSRNGLPTSSNQQRFSRFWSYFFKDERWIDRVLAQTSPATYLPVPNIAGRDLPRVLEGRTKSSYLALVMHDFSGEIYCFPKLFFESLQPHIYNKEKDEVYFLGSGITLNVCDATRNYEHEMIPISDPRRLFRSSWNKLSTYVICYKKDAIHFCPNSSIGGVRGVLNRKKAIADICCVRIPYAPNYDYNALFCNPSTINASRFIPIVDPRASGRSKVIGWTKFANY